MAGGRRVSNAGQNLREVVRAICVLALLFLNFGHAQTGTVAYSADLTPYLTTALASADICQDAAPTAPEEHHAPCHACRIGAGADLPPAPCTNVPAFVEIERTAYAEPLQPVVVGAYPRILGAQAPPVA